MECPKPAVEDGEDEENEAGAEYGTRRCRGDGAEDERVARREVQVHLHAHGHGHVCGGVGAH